MVRSWRNSIYFSTENQIACERASDRIEVPSKWMYIYSRHDMCLTTF